jgi:hypothetical protein
VDPLEDIKMVVKTATVELIENLHLHEGIEYESVHPRLFLVALIRQDLGPSKVKDEGDDELVDGLSDYHFPHCESNQWSGLWVGFPIQQASCWRIGS